MIEKLVVGLLLLAAVALILGIWLELRALWRQPFDPLRRETLNERRKRLGLPPLPGRD